MSRAAVEDLLLELALRSIDTLSKRGHERNDKTLLMSAVANRRSLSNGPMGAVFSSLLTRLGRGKRENFNDELLEMLQLDKSDRMRDALASARRFTEMYRDLGYVFAKPLPDAIDEYSDSIIEDLELARQLCAT